jgi:hypothetical protein
VRIWVLVAIAACYTGGPPPTREERPIALYTAGPPPSPRPAPLALAGPAQYCQRASDGCWDCAEMAFPDEVPCANQSASCAGICVHTGPRARCAPTTHACCPSGPCETPPITARCDAECGDPTGDHHNDRCLVPASCPYKQQLADFFGVYAVKSPPALFETLCGAPIPTTFASDLGDGAKVKCGPADVMWTIHPKAVAKGMNDSGPAICYGQVRVASVGGTVQRCGKFHCQTLRTCDGRDRPEYCTLLADCVGGTTVTPTGFSW